MPSSESPEMPFLEHLGELRGCLCKIIIACVIASLACFGFSNDLFHFLTKPMVEAAGSGKLVGLGPAEAFIVKLKVALVGGIVLASPITFWQIWKFISPGLHEKEQKLAMPFVIVTSLCFLIGISFCYSTILPFAFGFFLAEFKSIAVEPTIRIGEYLTFTVKLLMVFGLVFELPVITWFMARMNLLTADWLKRNARYALMVIFILAAILTPPDIATQLLLAFPLIFLYGICILIAKLAAPTPKSPSPKSDVPTLKD